MSASGYTHKHIQQFGYAKQLLYFVYKACEKYRKAGSCLIYYNSTSGGCSIGRVLLLLSLLHSVRLWCNHATESIWVQMKYWIYWRNYILKEKLLGWDDEYWKSLNERLILIAGEKVINYTEKWQFVLWIPKWLAIQMDILLFLFCNPWLLL